MDNMGDFDFSDVDLDNDVFGDDGMDDMFNTGADPMSGSTPNMSGNMQGINSGNPNMGGYPSGNNMGGGNTGADLFDDGSGGSDFFDDSMDDTDDADPGAGLSKKYIIVIACGVVFTLLVLVLGSRILGGKKNNSNEMLDTINNQQTVTKENTNVNVDNIMGSGNKQQSQGNTSNSQDISVNYHKDENEFSWMEITDSENVEFEGEYAERIFTITTVKHYARTVDSANNLVIKTTLTGSISGLPGTYTLEVPYSKGVKLSTGNSFTVNVLMGKYNDKIVVGDITY